MSDANRKPLMDAAESETLRMCGNSMHGNRETLETPASQDAGRSGKAVCRTPDMHVFRESGPIQRGRESLLYVNCGLVAKTPDPFELARR